MKCVTVTSDVEKKSISCDGNRWHLIYMRERIREQWRRVRKGCNFPPSCRRGVKATGMERVLIIEDRRVLLY